MHQADKDRKAITSPQVDQFYNLLVEMFPGKASEFQKTVEQDNASPDERIGRLMGVAYDWFHWGN